MEMEKIPTPKCFGSKLKKRSYRVEKYAKKPFYLFWYEKLSNSIFGNSFEELEQYIIDLQSEEKLSNLLQGLEVSKMSFNACIYIYIYMYVCMYINY